MFRLEKVIANASHASSEWFGGQKQAIPEVHALYSSLLLTAFRQKYPLNSEIIFTTMLARYPHLVKAINLVEPLAFWPFELDNYHGPYETTFRHLNVSQPTSSSPFHFS